jgi:hypothetical protein
MPFSLPLCAPPSRAASLPFLPLPFVLPVAEKRLRCCPVRPVSQTPADHAQDGTTQRMSSLLDFYGITSAASASGGGEDEPAGGASDEPRAKDDRKELASENFEAQVSKHTAGRHHCVRYTAVRCLNVCFVRVCWVCAALSVGSPAYGVNAFLVAARQFVSRITKGTRQRNANTRLRKLQSVQNDTTSHRAPAFSRTSPAHRLCRAGC